MARAVLAAVVTVGVPACEVTPQRTCSDFASGSLTDSSPVPASVDTALGVELVFLSIDGGTLDMEFRCSSNGELLAAQTLDGSSFDLNLMVDDAPYRIEFSWTPGDDITFSVAVMAL